MARSTKRLGEILIERGELTRTELGKALKAQLMFGGHLGTNLIELGLVEESVLARCLADLLGVREATPDLLRDALPEALAVVSRQTAERLRVVPLRIDGDALHLAAVDPRDLGAMSATTGYRLVPYVAPEVRIYEALETHYGVPRRTRFINLSHEVGHGAAAGVGSRAAATIAARVGGPDRQELADAVAAVPATLTARDTTDMGAEFGYGQSWRDIAEALEDAPDRHAAAATRAGAVTGPPAAAAEVEMVERVVAADHGDQLAAAFLDWAAPSSAGAILFAVKDTTARLWDWRGVGLAPAILEKLRFPVTGGSIFTVLLGEASYRGPVPDDAGAQAFYGALRHDVPDEIAVHPVHLDDRLVALVYLEGTARAPITASEDDLGRMIRRLTLGMSLVILKRRIRAC